MKRSWINRRSQRNKDRSAEAKPVRDRLIKEAGRCMICGSSPQRRIHPIAELNQLCCHEVLGGPLRQKVLDEPCAILVLCWYCNQNEVEDKGAWPHARQLAVLQAKSPDNYDLARFCWLRNENAPKFVEQYEVDYWIEEHNKREGLSD